MTKPRDSRAIPAMRLFSVLVVATLTSCGGKAVVDGPLPGEGGATASSGSGRGGSGAGSTTTTSVPPDTSSTGPTTGSTGGGAGPPQICDDSGSCQQCNQCAVSGPCAGEWQACFGSNQCQQLFECIQDCDGGNCLFQCAQSSPGGAQLFFSALRCSNCDACENDCAGTLPPQLCDGGFGPGGPGGPGG